MLSDILSAREVCDPAEVVISAWETASIKEGFIGRHLTFVPLGAVKVRPDSLEAAVLLAQVEDAPDIALA